MQIFSNTSMLEEREDISRYLMFVWVLYNKVLQFLFTQDEHVEEFDELYRRILLVSDSD